MVLVDTSVWIEFLDRFNPLVRTDLAGLLRTNVVATAGIIISELRAGCRSKMQVQEVLETMTPLVYHEVDERTWLHAGELVADGAARGFKLAIGDCLLAALALREKCEIFTLDRDFEHIPGIQIYRSHLN